MKKLLLVLGGLIPSILSLGQTTVTLPCNRDVSIAYHGSCITEDTNYEWAPQLAAWMIPGHESCGGFNNNQGVFDFQMDTFPSNAIVLDARLNLYALYDGGYPLEEGHVGEANESYIERITEPWDEYTITWNTRPSSTNEGAAYLANSENGEQDYLNIDVTEMVQEMISTPDNANGFLLRLVEEESYNILGFHSKDTEDENKIPTLTVTYEISTGTSNFDLLSKVNILPNPAIDNLQIQSTYKVLGYSIRNITGKLIQTKSVPSNSIDVTELNTGLYFITIETEAGAVTKKFVKQ